MFVTDNRKNVAYMRKVDCQMTINVYDLQYDPEGMCCLTKQRGTGYDIEFTVKDTKSTVGMIYNTFYPTVKAEQYYYMIACDREKKIIGLFVLAYGDADTTKYSVKSVLIRAMICHATYVVIVRNSPEGDCIVDMNELEYFRKLKENANAVGITVLDNIILSEEKYLSYDEQGIQ